MSRTFKPKNDIILKLLGSAELEFARSGFTDARLEDIASHAGVRRPSLLHHFSSKAELYRQVVEGAFEELGQVLIHGIAAGAGGQRGEILTQVVDALMDFAAQRPAVPTLIFRELLDTSETGERMLENGLMPLIDRLEELVCTKSDKHATGGDELPEKFPTRDAIVALVLAEISRVALSPKAKHALWRSQPSQVPALVQILFVDTSTKG